MLQLCIDPGDPLSERTLDALYAFADSLAPNPAAEQLRTTVESVLSAGHGDLDQWAAAIAGLPEATDLSITLNQPEVTVSGQLVDAAALNQCLKALIPWRKGPYRLHDVLIDTEWRSDLKWARISDQVDVVDKRIADVGSGNGYFGWRMLGEGARSVLSVDRTLLFAIQFLAVHQLLGKPAQHQFLPISIDDWPSELAGFDTVFCMGVLYHHRQPLALITRLRDMLERDGMLVMETLVWPGEEPVAFTPSGRYARMRNVWSLPTVSCLHIWLSRLGFDRIKTIDVTPTTSEEQRSTRWMPFESLDQCLSEENPAITVEGHPAPIRATLTARRK